MSTENLNMNENVEFFSMEMEKAGNRKSNKLGLDPKNVEQGLSKLVLTIVELLKRLLEKQALRRIENGTVTEQETENMGETFMKLDEKMIELREIFGLEESDLNIDLGPLGKLL